MKYFELESCITKDVNCVEIYICNTPPKKNEDSSSIINIAWSKTNDLNNVLKINNQNLPSFSCGYDIRQSEMLFTNSFVKIGKELIPQKSFSCYPINHHMCADHSIHRNNSGHSHDNGRYFFQVGIKDDEKWE